MTNFLSQLPPLGEAKKKRVGRGLGSGRGAKSGRGTTRHQKARETIPLHFEGGQAKVIKKFPLLRGKGKNKSKRAKAVVIPIARLNLFTTNSVVDMSSLVKNNLIREQETQRGVKILANGELKKKLIVKLPVSRRAGEVIVAAGGKVEST